MILQFTVKNFRSYKEGATLYFDASGSNVNSDVDLIKLQNGQKLLPSVGIFGANASGKSNLLDALRFMAEVVIEDSPLKSRPFDNRLIKPYLLDKNYQDKPISMQIALCDQQDGCKEYVYGFQLSKGYVVSEHLNVKEKSGANFSSRRVFESKLEAGQFKFSFSSKDKSALSPLASRVVPEGLALTRFATFGHEISRKIISLMNTSLRGGQKAGFYCISIPDIPGVVEVAQNLYKHDPTLVESANDLLNFCDFGIKDIQINSQNISANHHQYNQNKVVGNVNFDINDESLGTRIFFGVSIIIKDALHNGGVMIVDDLGSVTHPLLTAQIVKQFNSKDSNPLGAQLIYASHEDYLLSPEVGLRKDQIYFTKKDNQGSSYLDCLTQYKDLRNESDFRRDYLFGRFGALPNINLN